MSPVIFSLGTTTWTPLEARTCKAPLPAGQCLDLVGPHAGAVQHDAGVDGGLAAVLDVTYPHADDPVGLAGEADRLCRRPDDRAVLGGGARNGQRVPGVVGLRVVVAHGADQRVAAQPREQAQRRGPGQVLLARARCSARPACRRARARRRRRGAPTRGASADTGTTRPGRDAARGSRSSAPARAMPRAPVRTRVAPDSAGRRGTAWTSDSTSRTAMSRASTSATVSPRVAASSAAPAPVTPPPMTTTSNESEVSRCQAASR